MRSSALSPVTIPLPGGAHVEDDRVVPRGADPLDHAVDPGLDRIEQLPLPARRLLLQLLRALLQLLLLALEILPALGALGRAQDRRLGLEVLRRRVQAGLELLDLRPVTVQLLREGRFRLGVAGRRLEDRLDVHEADPGRHPGRRRRPRRASAGWASPRASAARPPGPRPAPPPLRARSRYHERQASCSAPDLKVRPAQKVLPSLKCSCHPGAGLPNTSTLSNP